MSYDNMKPKIIETNRIPKSLIAFWCRQQRNTAMHSLAAKSHFDPRRTLPKPKCIYLVNFLGHPHPKFVTYTTRLEYLIVSLLTLLTLFDASVDSVDTHSVTTLFNNGMIFVVCICRGYRIRLGFFSHFG